MVVLLDLDSTVYDLLTPTLLATPGVKPSDVVSWEFLKKPEYFKVWNTEGFYLGLQPFPGAVEAIKKVHEMGIRQVFLSSANFKYGTEKFRAVDRDFPFIGAKDTLLTGGSKDLVKGDVLVDDGPHNLEEFSKCGGDTILANLYGAPYCKYPAATSEITNWSDYPILIKLLACFNGEFE